MRGGIHQPLARSQSRIPAQPAVGAVFAAIAVLESYSLMTGGQSFQFVLCTLQVVGMDQLGERSSQQLVVRISKRLLPGRIDAAEITLDAGNAQQVAREREEPIALGFDALALRQVENGCAAGDVLPG